MLVVCGRISRQEHDLWLEEIKKIPSSRSRGSSYLDSVVGCGRFATLIGRNFSIVFISMLFNFQDGQCEVLRFSIKRPPDLIL